MKWSYGRTISGVAHQPKLHSPWPLTSTFSNDLITSSMGDEVFIFKEKFDRPVARSSTLVKTLQMNKTKLPKQNSVKTSQTGEDTCSRTSMLVLTKERNSPDDFQI